MVTIGNITGLPRANRNPLFTKGPRQQYQIEGCGTPWSFQMADLVYRGAITTSVYPVHGGTWDARVLLDWHNMLEKPQIARLHPPARNGMEAITLLELLVAAVAVFDSLMMPVAGHGLLTAQEVTIILGMPRLPRPTWVMFGSSELLQDPLVGESLKRILRIELDTVLPHDPYTTWDALVELGKEGLSPEHFRTHL
mgnify:CR=1 FL=1